MHVVMLWYPPPPLLLLLLLLPLPLHQMKICQHTIETIYIPSRGWRIDSTYLVHQSSARVYQHGAVASVCQAGRHTVRHTVRHTRT